jgi:hypothetical protein
VNCLALDGKVNCLKHVLYQRPKGLAMMTDGRKFFHLERL